MKTYTGRRERSGRTRVFVINDINGDSHPLPLRLDLFNHSPTGFEWGYGGSGPAQLALAILVDVFGDKTLAVKLHQTFKFRVIGALDHSMPFVLTERQVRDAVIEIQKEKAKGVNHVELTQQADADRDVAAGRAAADAKQTE